MIHILTPLLAFLPAPLFASWFGPDEEKIDLRNQLAQSQDENGLLVVVIAVLVVITILSLILGTILGSWARRKAAKQTEKSHE